MGFSDFIRDRTSNIGVTTKKIIAIGVGGGGCNTISYLADAKIDGLKLMTIDKDKQNLSQIQSGIQLCLGSSLTKGDGAKMKMFVDKESVMENYYEIKNILNIYDGIIIVTGLGGSTGSEISPIIAKIAKEVGALTISIASIPFMFEGQECLKIAEDALLKLKAESDSTIVIHNDKLLSAIDKSLGLKECFKIVDNFLAQDIQELLSLLNPAEHNEFNLDYEDLKLVLTKKGTALIGVGEYKGEEAAIEAIKIGMASLLFNQKAIDTAMSVIVNFNTRPYYPVVMIANALNLIDEMASDDADVIFGVLTDKNLPEDYVKITIVVAGFEEEEEGNFTISPS